MDYSGRIITKNAVTPSQTSAPGVWTLQDQILAQQSNTWPVPGVYNPISRSLRFNAPDSTYLNRTPTTTGSQTTFTFSAWIKLSAISAAQYILFDCGSYSPQIQFYSNRLNIYGINGSTLDVSTSAVLRDTSAWYHIVVVLDSTQATASNRAKLYINGTQATALTNTSGGSPVYPPQNTTFSVNTAVSHTLGGRSTVYFGGYLAEINFIDGQALTPSSFGTTDPQTGVWVPVAYTGTYGTNGFYVNFKDNTSTTTIGYDYSGNGNNWTANNFSVSPGSGNDSLIDVPTPWLPYNTAGDIGGVVRGNYCTLNPLDISGTLANGNLDYTGPTALASVRATFGMTSGKWYWENTVTSSSSGFGIAKSSAALTTYIGGDANGWGYYGDGQKYTNASGSAYGSTFTTNDIIGVAFDADAGSLYFYKNGVVQNSGTAAFTSLTSGPYFPGIGDGASGSAASATANFGQRPFAYTPPSGYKSLCTTNLPTPTIGATSTTQASKYFNAILYTGNSPSSQTISTGFYPDLIWEKSRTQAYSNVLYDSVRGVQKRLSSNETAAESTVSTSVTAFASSSFTVGSDGELNDPTGGGNNHVAWVWNANSGSTVSNTSGTITSTVSANTTAGFSIVVYTGNGVDGATVGHGLGVVPSMVIQKRRDGSIASWRVWHSAIYATSGVTDTLFLNTTAASGADSDNISGVSSTTFTTRGTGATNPNGNSCVAYVFAAVAGYSAFGKYTGNGSADGPFVYTGFRPRFILYKRTDTATNWVIWDTSRNTYNVTNLYLLPNSSGAEGTLDTLDILSNGFKLRTTNADNNGSGGTFIYAAFAENPFKYSNAR